MSGMVTIKMNAPAAANYGDKIGYIVMDNGVAGECVLAGAAAAGEDSMPLGVITAARDELGGEVTICVAGLCDFVAGGVITKGTHSLVKSDASSKGVAAADADAVWTVGRILFNRETATVDTGMYRMLVAPRLIEV